MEISSLPKHAFRVKSKHASVIINPSGKTEGETVLHLRTSDVASFVSEEGVVIASPGEYEIGGIKIRGTRTGSAVVFSLIVDHVSVLVGTISELEKAHSKLQEHDIVVVDVDTLIDPSFMTGLTSHVLILVGEKADEAVQSFLKENVKKQPKFVSTKEKLPQEVETILLA